MENLWSNYHWNTNLLENFLHCLILICFMRKKGLFSLFCWETFYKPTNHMKQLGIEVSTPVNDSRTCNKSRLAKIGNHIKVKRFLKCGAQHSS